MASWGLVNVSWYAIRVIVDINNLNSFLRRFFVFVYLQLHAVMQRVSSMPRVVDNVNYARLFGSVWRNLNYRSRDDVWMSDPNNATLLLRKIKEVNLRLARSIQSLPAL